MRTTAKLHAPPTAAVVTEGMLARVGGDRELLADVIGFFLEDGPTLITTIRNGLVDGNYTAVHRAAHSLAGSAGNFDATAVTALARNLEAQAIAVNTPASREAFSELETETSQLLAYLTAIRATLSCAS